MPADASIYQNVRAPEINLPSPLASAQQAMTLSQLGMQQEQHQMQMQQQRLAFQQQMAARQAYADNTDPNTGSINKAGVLSQLGKGGWGQLASEMGSQFSAQDKAAAEARGAQAEASDKMLNVTGPAFDLLKNMPESQREAAYPRIIQQLKDQKIDVSSMDHPYDPALFNQYYANWQSSKPHLEQQLKQVEIAAKLADIGAAPAKRNAELYGSRSPNAELTSQYDKQAAPIRSSQQAMQQMMDNYNHPSPQGDASLILNAFKIKFPNAPDVNSLKELSDSQSASDHWKNMANKAISGGLDQNTRDNLMRDGVSTFRANVDSLKGVQQRYQSRARVQNVNDPTLTYEPAIDETHKAAMALQDKIGPYKPPSERGGITGALSGIASKFLGGGAKTAVAAPPSVKPGAVEDGYVFMGGDPSNQKSWKKAR